jgi:hypothetical protein
MAEQVETAVLLGSRAQEVAAPPTVPLVAKVIVVNLSPTITEGMGALVVGFSKNTQALSPSGTARSARIAPGTEGRAAMAGTPLQPAWAMELDH